MTKEMTTIRNIYRLVDVDTSEMTTFQLEDLIDQIQNELEWEFSLEELGVEHETAR